MVSATGNIRKEKTRNSGNYLRIQNGLKKKAFELSTLVGVDVCMIILDPAQQHVQGTVEPGTYPDNSQEVHRIIQRYRDYITTTTTTTTGVLGGKKNRKNNRDVTQKKKSAEVLVTSSIEQDDHDDALLKGRGSSLLQNFETEEEELENEFMEELRNELIMGFDEHNVNINNQLHQLQEEEMTVDENLLDSSLSEFLVEGDMIWSSDELNEILNGFGGDHHYEDNNMFDLLAPLSDPSPPLPLTDNAFIDNILNTTSDNWPAGTMVEYDQLFS